MLNDKVTTGQVSAQGKATNDIAMSMPKQLSMTRYLAMELLAAANDKPHEEVLGYVLAEGERAKSFGLLSSVAEYDHELHDWVFWQKPGHSPELSIEEIAALPPANVILVISLTIKGVLEMKAWHVNQVNECVALQELPIEVNG